MKPKFLSSLLGLALFLPLVASAGVTLDTEGVAGSFDLPDDYTLTYSSGPVVVTPINGVGTTATRSYGANIGDGVVALSMTAYAERTAGAGTATANAKMNFSFSDTLYIQSSSAVTLTLTPYVSISSSGGANTGWTSHAKFSLNSAASTFATSGNTEDWRTESSTIFTASAFTVTFDPSAEVNQTASFILGYTNFFSENAWAQAVSPVTGNSTSLDLQYYMRITDITGGAIVTSASGTDYTASVSAVPEPSAAAAFAGLIGLTMAGAGRRRRPAAKQG